MNLRNKFKNFTILTGTSITAIHLLNKLAYHFATIENLLKNKDELYYNSKFGKIFYTKSGSGNPILLIHDLDVCSSSYEWNRVVEELSKTNTVYTIDLLGCGRSDKPNLIYTNYVFVNLITDFIKNIIGQKTDIIATGHSASISLMTCVNDDTIIDKVILINPESLTALLKVPDKSSKNYRHMISVPIIGTFIYNIIVNQKSIEQNFKHYYYHNKNKVNEKDIDIYLESAHKSYSRGKYLYASMKSGYTNTNVSNFLNKISNPIYIIIGNSNPENELNANQYENLLPSIKIRGIDNAKYLPQLEVPDNFTNEISKIMNESITFDSVHI